MVVLVPMAAVLSRAESLCTKSAFPSPYLDVQFDWIPGLRADYACLQKAMEGLQAVTDDMSSTLLQRLVTPGQALPAFAEPLDALVAAADWEEAAAQGRVIPTPVSHGAAYMM